MHFLCAPVPKSAGRLRLFALFLRPHDENCRQSHAVCSPVPKNAERLRLFAPPFMKPPTVSGSEHSAHENSGTSWAVCIFLKKLPTVSGCFQFLCVPIPKIAGRLRLFAPPMMKIADSLRLFALHSRKMRDVSGFLHRHDEIADSLRLFALFV